MEKFNRNLKQGLNYEKEAIKYFKYDKAEFSEGYFTDYDIKLIRDEDIKFLEVKSERYASISGNLCIEYNYKNKPSGINKTKANYWVHFVLHTDKGLYGNVISHDCYIFPIKKLKKILKGCRTVKSGDNKYCKSYLLPLTKCKNYLYTL